jgi:hypothetical protein
MPGKLPGCTAKPSTKVFCPNRAARFWKAFTCQKPEGTNKFYRKNGFVLAKQITIHGNEVSNVYVKEI